MKHLTLTLILLLASCQTPRESDPHATAVFHRPAPTDLAAGEYRLLPPDHIILRASGIAALDNLTLTIRPDGRIVLPLIGELPVTNKTPRELSAEITALAARFYPSPNIHVDVAESRSHFYAITGIPLRNAGKRAVTGRDTVVSALVDAGFTADAWPQQVLLSRPESPDNPRTTVVIDFKQLAETGDLTQNYLLKEGDIVHVKNSPLAQFRITTQNLLAPINQSIGTAQLATPAR